MVAIMLLLIPELCDHVRGFLGYGVSLRTLNMALIYCKRARKSMAFHGSLCNPVDCVHSGLLHTECRVVCGPFLSFGLRSLLQLTMRTVRRTVTAHFAPYVNRSVMHVHLLLHTTNHTDKPHVLHTITVRFTHCTLSLQWWVQQHSGVWVPVEPDHLATQLLPISLMDQPARDDDMLGIGFDLTGQCQNTGNVGRDVWQSAAGRVATKFHMSMVRETTAAPKGLLRYTSWPTQTPWIGYHYVAGRITWVT